MRYVHHLSGVCFPDDSRGYCRRISRGGIQKAGDCHLVAEQGRFPRNANHWEPINRRRRVFYKGLNGGKARVASGVHARPARGTARPAGRVVCRKERWIKATGPETGGQTPGRAEWRGRNGARVHYLPVFTLPLRDGVRPIERGGLGSPESIRPSRLQDGWVH